MSADANASSPGIFSPCVGICCIAADGLCIGCHRTRAELADWYSATNGEKREILERCRLRQLRAATARTRNDRRA